MKVRTLLLAAVGASIKHCAADVTIQISKVLSFCSKLNNPFNRTMIQLEQEALRAW